MTKDNYGFQNTPKSYAISSPWSKPWNAAEGKPVEEQPSGETNPRPDNLVGKNVNPTSGNVTDFMTSDFDPSDTNQVLQLQKSLGVTEDGQFGPKTEAAYRNMVNERRSAEGKEIYHYDDARRIEQPIQSQIPPDENPVIDPMDGNGNGPDPIGEGYTPEYFENKDQGYKYAGHDSFSDFLKTDINNPETWASSEGRTPWGQEYGPQNQEKTPIMQRNNPLRGYVKDTTGSLWGMLKGMFN